MLGIFIEASWIIHLYSNTHLCQCTLQYGDLLFLAKTPWALGDGTSPSCLLAWYYHRPDSIFLPQILWLSGQCWKFYQGLWWPLSWRQPLLQIHQLCLSDIVAYYSCIPFHSHFILLYDVLYSYSHDSFTKLVSFRTSDISYAQHVLFWAISHSNIFFDNLLWSILIKRFPSLTMATVLLTQLRVQPISYHCLGYFDLVHSCALQISSKIFQALSVLHTVPIEIVALVLIWWN